MEALLLALSLLTIVPVPAQVTPTRTRAAIAFTPIIGVLLGVAAALLLWGLTALGSPPLLGGLLTVAMLALITRGMHVDGLADTVDGLGCYGPPERALSVMRDGSAGPFAVVALILVIGVQAVSLAHLAASANWLAVVLACALGRAAFVFLCRRGIPAARPDGLGAHFAGTQPWWAVVAWWVALGVLGSVAVRDAWWLGVLGVAVSAVTLTAFARHVQRKLGGITGDVLGAGCELSTAIVLAVCSFR